jgi:predicted esterase
MDTRVRRFWAGLVLVAAAGLWPAAAGADVITLKNGMIIEGTPEQIASMQNDPSKGRGPTDVMQILIVDNQLTRTFVTKKQLARELGKPPAIATERILLPGKKIAAAGRQIYSVGQPIRIDPFDEWGNRIFVMQGPKGSVAIVQGITEITPRWTKVEAIQGINSYILDQRIATSSIPRTQLSKILYRTLDSKDPNQRLRIVRLYLQSERFKDARLELEQLIKDFPDLAELKEQVKTLHQLFAQQVLKEIELRRDAGQYRLAVAMLQQFPADGVAGETLLKVRDMLGDIERQQKEGQKVLELLDQHTAALKDDATRRELKPIVEEIRTELNINTLDRLADYLRLADDPKMSDEQKLSLAISGWLLGSGGGLDNLAVSKSLFQIRDLVRQYMLTTRKPERDNILSRLTSLEGSSLDNLTKLMAHMKPPVETEGLKLGPADVCNPAAILDLPGEEAARPAEANPPAAREGAAKEPAPGAAPEEGGECAPKDKEDDAALLKGPATPPAPKAVVEPPVNENAPAQTAAAGTGIPGLFELTVKSNLSEEPEFKYWVQVPPEYDPYRHYPCLLTLNGAGTTPLKQIDWFAGSFNSDAGARFDQATRHGYIVIAPQWTREHQREYEFSAREHAAVLLTLRDACKRFAIDTDRVFLTGHSMGGDAAWDIGLAHPDLWAGIIPIVATSSKYIRQYAQNAEYVPMYFVNGAADLGRREANATDWTDYLRNPRADVMVVEYLGRGHESFHDEIQNLFTWTNLHKRDFFPRKFITESLRPWDNFFWWVETAGPRAANTILPAEWGENPVPAKKPHPARTDAKVLATNGVMVTNGSCEKVTVWLSPEFVAFDGNLKVTINNKPQRKIQPSVETLLEDVRTRGDRQHPFWAKVAN